MIIDWFISFFFISLIINIFVTVYTVYLFFEINIFNHGQGAKLKLKKQDFINRKDD